MSLETNSVASRIPGPDRRHESARQALRDAALVQEVADGSTSALAALYDLYADVIYSLGLGVVRSAPDAEEIVEDTFWQAWQSAPSFDPGRGSVRSWLCTIARSRALDRLRRRRVRADSDGQPLELLGDAAAAPVLADWDAFHPMDPSAALLDADDAITVRRALDLLPAPQRELIVLAYFRGLSQTEIAATTRIPLGTVKSRMRRGMERLRDALRTAA